MANKFEQHPSYREESAEIKTPEELKEAKQMAGVTTHEEAMRRFEEYEARLGLPKESMPESERPQEKLVERKEILSDGKALRTRKYIYDTEGNLTEEKVYGIVYKTEGEKYLGNIAYEYNKKGRVVREIRNLDRNLSTSNYSSKTTREYKYDNTERLSQVKELVAEGRFVTYDYKYSDGDRKREEEVRNPDGSFVEKNILFYDEHRRVVGANYHLSKEVLEKFPSMPPQYHYKYNREGRLQEVFREGGISSYHGEVTQYSYKKEGAGIKITATNTLVPSGNTKPFIAVFIEKYEKQD